ncbi:hypothetical protein BDW62DRAFT_200236 [Aspergillus aurantiobrunneus]
MPLKLKDGTKSDPPNLNYLSIQHAVSGHTVDGENTRWVPPNRVDIPQPAENSVTGQNIYRVIRCGSREEVAAQAFYAASGNQWSTVFSCVVVGGRSLSGRVMVCDADEYERVNSVEGLAEDNLEGEKGAGGKIKVFY